MIASDFGHILILGAGHAGGFAAAALRQASSGQITLLGNEPHPPYERPPLSKELLAGAVPVEKTYLRPLAFYDDSGNDASTRQHRVAIDRTAQRVALKDGETVAYDELMLTTGARLRAPADPRRPGHAHLLSARHRRIRWPARQARAGRALRRDRRGLHRTRSGGDGEEARRRR